MTSGLLAALVLLSVGGDLDPNGQEQLVADLHEMLTAPHVRSVPESEVIEGTFGELATLPLEALQDARFPRGLSAAVDEAVLALSRTGRVSSSILSSDWQSSLDAAEPALATLLLAGRARSGAPLQSWYILTLDQPNANAKVRAGWHRAVQVATLSFLSELARGGDASSVLRRCGALFAVGRDLSEFAPESNVRLALPACAAAAMRADSAALDEVEGRLALIQRDWFPVDRRIRFTRAREGWDLFFETLTPSNRAALPPKPPERGVSAWRVAAFGTASRRTAARFWTSIEQAIKLPPPEGDASLKPDRFGAALYSQFSDHRCWTPAVGGEPEVWLRLLREQGMAVAQLQAVVGIAQFKASHRRWPASWEDLGKAPFVDPRSGLPMRLSVSDGVGHLDQQADPPRTDKDYSVVLY